jgi:hypothetical protein
MSLVYWGIVAGVISMVALVFFCIAVIPGGQNPEQRDDSALARDDEAAREGAARGSRHAA